MKKIASKENYKRAAWAQKEREVFIQWANRLAYELHHVKNKEELSRLLKRYGTDFKSAGDNIEMSQSWEKK